MDAKCFLYRSWTTAFSGFAMNASRSFHVIAAKRRHSFPPIWLKMILVNLPSAVRSAAFDLTDVATRVADEALVAAFFTRFEVGLSFLVFFAMVASLLGLGRYHTRVERES